MKPTFHTCRLSNGLRIIHEERDSEVMYCGYVMGVGTRHEAAAESGMAHFIEHMTFKGTEHRRAWQISNGLERVGGELNAFTNKQETVYCATVLQPDFRRAVDLLTDIVFHSTYPQAEIDREVEVICDEIDSYKDSPGEIIFDEFEEILFPGADLGRDILGDAQRLRSYTTDDALRFTARHYRPDNAVFYAYGRADFRRLVGWLQGMFGLKPEPITENCDETGIFRLPEIPDLLPEAPAGREIFRDKGTHQAHVLLGCTAYGGCHPRRYAMMLLSNLLGGPGMNARLNMLLRERAGLVYTVESNYSAYVDVGVWSVYFGCDAHDVSRCVRMVRRELQRCAESPLSPRQLAAAKQQLIGQIGIAQEQHESHAITMGKAYARYGLRRDPATLAERIQALTAEEVQRAAAEIFRPERLTLLAYRTPASR